MSIHGLNGWVNEQTCEVWEAVKSAFEVYPELLADQLGMPALSSGRRAAGGAYHDGEAVVSLDTVLVTLCFGVLAAPQLGVGGKVQVMVHDLTPLHEEQGSVLVQNTLLTQVVCNLVGYFAGLRTGREGEEGLEEGVL